MNVMRMHTSTSDYVSREHDIYTERLYWSQRKPPSLTAASANNLVASSSYLSHMQNPTIASNSIGRATDNCAIGNGFSHPSDSWMIGGSLGRGLSEHSHHQFQPLHRLSSSNSGMDEMDCAGYQNSNLLQMMPGSDSPLDDSPSSLQCFEKSPSPLGFKMEPNSPTTSTTSSGCADTCAGNASGNMSSTGPGRRAKPKEEKYCGVCGDRALGFNFDAISCESCKAFFRRNASKGLNLFKCAYDGNCRMDVNNRRFCKRCRLAKCLEIGMKKEYILSEEEKAEKKRKIDQNKIVRNLETRGWLPRELAVSELEERELLTERDINLIDEVHLAYRDSLEVHLERRAGQRHQPMMDDLVNFAELSVRRVIDMSKKIEGFRLLSQEDQISLLKGGAVELLILRGMLCFDGDNQRFLEESDQEERDTMSAIDFLQGAGENGAGALFMQMWRSLFKELECDKTTLLLLLVICLFSSDRAHVPLESKPHIEELQLRYSMLMEKYIQTRARSVREARRIYPLVLSKLSDLRSINEEFSKRMITVNPHIIQPLMSELFDLSEVQRQQSGGHLPTEFDPEAELNVSTDAVDFHMDTA